MIDAAQKNGTPRYGHCPLWDSHKDQIITALVQVETIHLGLIKMSENLQHLSALSDIRDTLLASATGKDHVPIKIMLIILGTLGTVILGLVFVIVFLLTGETAGWLNSLHR